VNLHPRDVLFEMPDRVLHAAFRHLDNSRVALNVMIRIDNDLHKKGY
jgi:hypothetical protein